MLYKFNAFVLMATVLLTIGNGQVQAQAPDNQKALSSASDNGFQYAAPVRHVYNIPVKHTSPQYVLNTLKQAVSGSLQPFDWRKDSHMREIGYIIANERNNSLLVCASPEGFLWLKSLINEMELDLPREAVGEAIVIQNPALQRGEYGSSGWLPILPLFRISLRHTSPRYMLNKLKQAVSGSLHPYDWGTDDKMPQVEYIIPNERNHSLLVSTSEEGFARLAGLIKSLDSPLLDVTPPAKIQKPPVGSSLHK